ncbi:facilitated trehalose transporter Tret1-like [Pectinophora gossypiella]|uniref:facilitated trehalose transporter Tret1-like n=1 Tax=Pectinophora gossypiella TaxID=13191 RepID=UPI00214F481B|nr:facilitated trehalose transporter Tret1-like [Pectinophora gossypiella]
MKKYYLLFGEGSKINQIICAVLINLPVFGYGASIGWMSPMTLLLQSKDSPTEVPLTDYEISWMAAVAYLVCVPADFLMAILSDWMGRKKALLFISTASVIAWIIKLSSYQIWAFILARSCIGILMGGAYVTCPLYTKEISEDSIRGVLGSLVVLFHVSGNLFAYIIGDLLSYRSVLWVCLSIPTLHLVLFMMMPDSPSYLVKRGKTEEALRVLAWLRCRREDDGLVLKELEQIRNEQRSDDESSKFVAKAIVKDKILLRAFRIAIVVTLAREVCGAIPVTNFAGDIFANASEGTTLVLSPNQQAMMLGGVQVIGSLVASSVVEKTGRKPLLIITSLVSGISMCALGSWFVAREYGVWAPGWLPISSLCICIFCDSSGLQPVSVLVTGEMFSFKYRGTVMATTMSLASICGFLQMLFFKQVAAAIGVHVSFYFFGAICLTAAIYALLVVPETKLRSIGEIHEDLKTKKEKELELNGLPMVRSEKKDMC